MKKIKTGGRERRWRKEEDDSMGGNMVVIERIEKSEREGMLEGSSKV